VILGWTAQLSQLPNVKISPEHTEYAWMALEEGPNYDFGFAGEKGAFIRTMIDRSLGQGGVAVAVVDNVEYLKVKRQDLHKNIPAKILLD
jgi:hypothetical protein